MAQAIINSGIANLDPTSLLYDLYTRLYDGMTKANQVDAPDYTTDPPYEKEEDGSIKVDENGIPIIDQELIKNKLAEYSDILLKNSAYMLANAIVSTISPNGGEGGTSGSGFLYRNGDTMQGSLGALHGFEAGYNNTKIFETIIDSEEKSLAIVTGSLNISEDITISGTVNLSKGIFYGENQVFYYDDKSVLHIANEDITIEGSLNIDDSITIGLLNLNKDGIYYDGNEYYHSGNSNNQKTNWAMNDGHVYGNLIVDNDSNLNGVFTSNGGFSLNLLDNQLLYSGVKEYLNAEGDVIHVPYITLNTDLSIENNHGIKFNDNYIVWVRSVDNVVSFSAPGAIMNLGDSGENSDGEKVATKYIALQTNITNYNGAYNIITHDGTGNFPNGLSVGVANGIGDSTMQTYYQSSVDYGVVIHDNLRFGSADGPCIYGEGDKLKGKLSFTDMSGSLPAKSWINTEIYCDYSSSLIFNPTSNLSFSATHFKTDSAHFEFDKPIEVSTVAIKSSRYKTRLQEDVLFFDDGKFIEGIEGGMRYAQNSMFDGNLFSFNPDSSSISFSSGFAGSGWAIMQDVTTGNTHATFDNLTIRKKMRVYELEVQKNSITNGSLWVSDSCSGDEVRELN